MARASLSPIVLAVLPTGSGWVAVVPWCGRQSFDMPQIAEIKRRDELSPRQKRRFDQWLAWLGKREKAASA